MGGPGAPMGGPMGAPQGGFGAPMGAPMGGPVMGSPIGSGPQQSGGATAVKLIAGGIALAAVAVGIGLGVNYLYTHPSVYVVNVTGTDGLTVTLDGEPLASNLKNATAEDRSLVTQESVKSGVHKLEAKDATGKVLESFNFDFKSGFGTTYVYAPSRSPKTCFFIQTDEYKTNSAAPDKVADRFKPLDPTKTIWEMPESIDYWFQDSPDSVEIKTKKGQKPKDSVIKRALRQGACNDPNFQG
jgi:hypothetical protein